eukprot:CAMPEP_0197031822 /NCGR_PEP_ID=MMETSP1384-20130603/10689_1 /TAXON_ID=29189 /ORGANISM="Ammonia sp." /LENGTH=670 /DNA_ID=CAMNT_0042461397 /DNA_START=98 /DNA_END=2110 /DNA_ORIENTATION=-
MFRLKQAKRDRRYRAIKQSVISTAFIVLLCAAILIVSLQHIHARYLSDNLASSPDAHSNARQLLQSTVADTPTTTKTYEIEGADYPPDVFTESQLRSGALVLHIIGLFYMFLAIAIVCDEFFVPSIEVIVESLNMSPDVAGATFMAAGGSAPELFTSFFGTFVSKSSVGFGTIVGSAVFNVLFVIGCCAIFSTGDLVLTWYPFARDSIYYCVSLCILAGFFMDQVIYVYEAFILFALYIVYVIIMLNNARIYEFVDRKFGKHKNERERTQTMNEQLRPPQSIQTFSVSLFKMMTADANISEIAGIHIVARIKGDVKATFRQVDTDQSGYIDKEELRAVLQKLGGDVQEEEVDACFADLDLDSDGKIDEHEFAQWYLKSENRIEADVNQLFNKFDHDNDGAIDISELEELVQACRGGDEPADAEEVENARKILDANNDGQISREEFMNWYKSSKFFEKQKERANTLIEEENKEEDEGISLAFPENWKGRVMYIISAPIMYTLYFTVPDVRKRRWRKCWPMGFLMSIIWLGIYSYFMVWWATTAGRIIGIPDSIMGLTILAAGTSVPDLITSVLVAKEGHGDMAVSSSIGSNIFDILVGLPLPWIFATTIIDPSWEVEAEGIFISIFILFGMIAIVLAIIIWSKWRMTKTLGYSMFVLYVLFCVQDILRTYL